MPALSPQPDEIDMIEGLNGPFSRMHTLRMLYRACGRPKAVAQV